MLIEHVHLIVLNPMPRSYIHISLWKHKKSNLLSGMATKVTPSPSNLVATFFGGIFRASTKVPFFSSGRPLPLLVARPLKKVFLRLPLPRILLSDIKGLGDCVASGSDPVTSE